MSATDELRRMLDERGMEYDKAENDTTIYYDSDGNRYTYNVNPESGWAQLFGYHVTPEQAIAATLGSGECENVAPDYLDFLCSDCGFVHYHSDENDTGDGNDWAYCPRCGKAVKR